MAKSVFAFHNDSLQFEASNSYSGYLVVPIRSETSPIEDRWEGDIDYDFLSRIASYNKTFIPIDLGNLDILNDAIITRNYGNNPSYYEVAQICRHRTPVDNLWGESNLNFITYYQEKYGIMIKNTTQPLLRPKYLSKKRNMLRSNSGQKSQFSVKSCNKSQTQSVADTITHHSKGKSKVIELIPELCKRSIFPASVWKSLACIRSILWRMESMLSVKEFENKMQESWIVGSSRNERQLQNNSLTMTILKALTLARANDDFNLETLEFLGDSYLKYAVSISFFLSYSKFHEGQLSSLKSKIVSNENLYQIGIKMGLPGYIIGHNVDQNDIWVPPGFSIAKKSDSIGLEEQLSTLNLSMTSRVHPTQKLKNKCIADVMEALLGGILLELGENSANNFITNNLGIKVGRLSHNIAKLDDDARKEISKIYNAHNLKDLEAVLGYSFKDRKLLISALTHATYNHNRIAEGVECYQRLEFLGDAILQYIVVRHCYHANNNYKPADLHDFVEASLQNESLAVMTMVYGIHKYFFYNSPSLFSQINQLLQIVDTNEECEQRLSTEEKALVYSNSLKDGVMIPKPLGDLFESLIGAIFIDCGRSIEVVNDLVLRLLQPQHAIFAQGVPKSPIRILHEKFPSGLLFKKEKTEDNSLRKLSLQVPDGSYFTATGINYKHCKKVLCMMALRCYDENSN
ncbi:uncharacterized protein TRIADDRAFT_51985 [Trichoplax adhaerens]|uniref:Uncharacterized protein n=2 Tax=Trichoplax adhaerens TaxID=10228 RepID=B3RLF2_TRIAD|nr:hypothetical protein TRIADDRAFT_51985 [Trichoplax adhaerens]EDV28757.1 hypothetical protein TRIADDRAFT_51985 [Trichoplax adhaerens]|eukprot:XP_002107959.1 hypothetical protein TRIADDRAFT_51985 [Trichoplax adhaerens]